MNVLQMLVYTHFCMCIHCVNGPVHKLYTTHCHMRVHSITFNCLCACCAGNLCFELLYYLEFFLCIVAHIHCRSIILHFCILLPYSLCFYLCIVACSPLYKYACLLFPTVTLIICRSLHKLVSCLEVWAAAG